MAMDDFTTQLIKVPKIVENPHDFDLFHQDASSLQEIPDNFFEFNPLPLQCNYNQLIPQMGMGFQGFEDVGSWDFMLDNATFPPPCDYVVVDEKPVTTTMVDSFANSSNNLAAFSSSSCDYVTVDENPVANTIVDSSHYFNNINGDLDELSRMIKWGLQNWTKHEDESKTISNGNYKKSNALDLEDIQKYFDMPINQAAKELKVGVTLLKRRCRELNITRWPHRKIKSLVALIENAKDMGLTNEVRMLEEQRRLLEQLPDMELTDRAKKLRQAVFKANYKKKMRSLITAPRP